MKHFSLFLLIGLYSLLFSACFFQKVSSNEDSDESIYLSASEMPKGETTDDLSDLPETKVVMINTGSGVQETELDLFKADGMPFALYLPDQEFKGDVIEGEAGKEVHIYYEPNGKRQSDVEIEFLFPSEKSHLEDVQNLVLTGKNILSLAGLTIVDRTEVVAYPWVHEKFVYKQIDAPEGKASRGFAFIGQNLSTPDESDYFTVMVKYPEAQAEMIEGRTALILDNLEFSNRPFYSN